MRDLSIFNCQLELLERKVINTCKKKKRITENSNSLRSLGPGDEIYMRKDSWQRSEEVMKHADLKAVISDFR